VFEVVFCFMTFDPLFRNMLESKSEIMVRLVLIFIFTQGKQKEGQKDQIILAMVWGILADFWVPHEIESCNLQNFFVFGFPETSQNLISFK
jgi:hypothetical protein